MLPGTVRRMYIIQPTVFGVQMRRRSKEGRDHGRGAPALCATEQARAGTESFINANHKPRRGADMGHAVIRGCVRAGVTVTCTAHGASSLCIDAHPQVRPPAVVLTHIRPDCHAKSRSARPPIGHAGTEPLGAAPLRASN